MTAMILDGAKIAGEIKAELKSRIAGRKLGLGTILVGDDPGSRSYVAGKHRDCADIGINSIRVDLPSSISEADLLREVDQLNSDPGCTGFIIQLPLPSHINANSVLEHIDPKKDADGLHPINLGRLVLGQPAPIPCTPLAIVELAHRYEIDWSGKDVVIIGRGTTVGRPLGLLLSQRSINATVTTVHTGTRDLARHVKQADIVIAAMGKPHFVTKEMIKAGAVVFDVGITRDGSGLVGDVHPEVGEIASALAPMPGGVGPMTRAMLLSNLVALSER